ncbi:MAG: ATP-binding protein [Pseudomonadota bacterium]
MKDLGERLWPAFRAEVGEQLEALELLLVQRADGVGIDVNAMFRHFHTIKGGCAMMGYPNMGAIAHAAEDVLDPVRRGERTLDDGLVDLLLAAIDALKQQLQETETTRRDAAPHDDLVARLRGAPAMTVPAAASAAAPARAASSRAVPASTAGEKPAAPAGESLVAALRGQLDDLFMAALAADPADGRLAARLAGWRATAEPSGFTAIAGLLARVQMRLDSPAERRQAIGELVDRLAALESTSALDLGVQAAAHAARAQAETVLHESVERFADALSGKPRGTAAAPALAAVESLLALMLVLQLPHTVRLLRLAAQVLRDVVRRGLQPDSTLHELLCLSARMPLELQPGLDEDAPYAAMCSSLHQRLQDAASAAAGGHDLAVLRQRVTDVIDIRAELLDGLLPSALGRLAEAVAREATIVEIEADMESAPDSGAAFIAWLDDHGAQIGNQTVFHREVTGGGQRETTRLRFVAALPLTVADIRAALGRLDPQQQLFSLRPCLRRGEAVPAATPAVAPGAAAADAGARLLSGQTLRVDSTAVDQFVNRIGEMVTLRSMFAHALHTDELAARQRRARALLGGRVAGQTLAESELDELRALLAELDVRHERLMQTDLRMQGALGRLQEEVLALRVVPMAMVFNRLPRVVRDLAQAQQKKVALEVIGDDVRVDKSLVDVLLEPLMHLVRNAIDHGLETPDQRRAAGKPENATLSLAARQQGGLLLVEVADDGRGIDPERIRRRAAGQGLASAAELEAMNPRELANLIFLPGFSTADQVTEVSGRGVGMDVVKTRIGQIGGQVEVSSRPGAGTTFVLRLPLSVAIQSVILVNAAGRELAIPERHVSEIVSMPASSLLSVQGQACCLLRGSTLPLYALGTLLGRPGDVMPADANAIVEIVVVTDGIYRIGVVVERVLGRPEVFVRDVHPDIARLPGVGGVSVLGNGQVVIIVDCEKLFDLALRNAQSLRSLLRAS